MNLNKLMIIEDDECVRNTMSDALESLCKKIVSPSSEEEIEPLLEKEMPECVIVDGQLWDGLDGTDLIQGIKEKVPGVIVVMHTASEWLKERSLACGADGFVVKESNKKLKEAIMSFFSSK